MLFVVGTASWLSGRVRNTGSEGAHCGVGTTCAHASCAADLIMLYTFTKYVLITSIILIRERL